jgi:hypothetical protein
VKFALLLISYFTGQARFLGLFKIPGRNFKFAEGNGGVLAGIRPVKTGLNHPVDPVNPV